MFQFVIDLHRSILLLQERVKTGDPAAESEREAEFQRNKQVFVRIVKRVISHCRDGKEHEEIPFINSLLQNYDDEDKVNLSLSTLSLSAPPPSLSHSSSPLYSLFSPSLFPLQ
jgi:hypothetical protein